MADLVIVESPTKVKTIKKYLGNGYKVMASMGHIRDLPKSKLGLDVENGYKPEYINIRGNGKTELIRDLKKEAKLADNVYLATDPDREGEAISWHLAMVLGLDLNKKIRVTFNEITKKSVLEGLKHPRQINMDLVDAQQARRVLDRLVGYGISPMLWKHIRKGLSAGRVQSVATKLIVDRENEINSFVAEEYWKIGASLEKLSGKKEGFVARYHGKNGKKTAIKCEKDALELKSTLEAANYTVESVVSSQKQKTPMPPFTTSTMQQEASRLLNMTSKHTMQIAQNLYEGVEIPGQGLTGLITYMRTDSLRIAEEAISAAREYISGKYGAEYCPKTARRYKAKNGAQDAHEAIRPTSMQNSPEAVKGSLSRDQFRLYKLIWDRFVASQMSSQISNVVSVDILAQNGAEKHTLKASGSTVLFKGYTAVYLEYRDKDEDDGNLPALEEREELKLVKIDAEQKFTQPPSRYTEAALIKALEENGIGRPSTYAPTISTILLREYVERDGKSFKPTSLGTVTTEYMCSKFNDIVDVDFTARMEADLDKIGEGKSQWSSVIKEFDKGLEANIAAAKADNNRVNIPAEESGEVCELCGANMVIKSGKFGKFLACPNYPECKNTKALIHRTGAKCPKCGGEIVEKVSKRGTKYYACEKNPSCDFISWYEPTSKSCEVCGAVILKKRGFKGKVTYICANDKCPTNVSGDKK